MLQILDLHRSDLLAYRVSDVLSEEDVRSATDAFDALLDRHDTVHLYAEVEGLRGFEARALWLDLVYGLRRLGALRHIGRVALVTDGAWIRRLARLEARLLPIGRLNVYRPDARDEARAWVLGAPAPAEPASTDPTPEPLRADDPWADMTWFDEDWLDEDWLDADLAEGRAMDVASGRTDASRAEPRPRAPRFGHTVHRTHVLLRRVADELETSGSAPAYHALRAVLHALRDRLPDAEAADLAAQFTTLVRGVFYEGYRPSGRREKLDRAAFLDAVATALRPDAPFDAEGAIGAVARALAGTVSEGEWAQVLAALPQDIRSLFEAPVEA